MKKTKHKTGWGYMTQKVSFFDAKGQELACAVLCILAHGCHTDNQEKIIQVGAIEWVLTAMKAYLTKKMQEMTCDLLKNVCSTGIASGKVIDAIVQWLGRHSANAQVQEAGREALSNLARNGRRWLAGNAAHRRWLAGNAAHHAADGAHFKYTAR